MWGSRHKLPNELGSLGLSSEFLEAQAERAIPALDNAVEILCFHDDGRDDLGDPRPLN